jgi:hypothetical protein
MSDDTYFFEVSVAEHPQSKKRMNDLAKSVIEAQTEMTKAVSMVGDAASASFKNIGSLLDGIESLRSGGVGALRAIQAEVRALQELSRQKITLAVQVERQDSGAKAAGVTEADAPPSRAIGSGVNERDPRTYTDALQANQVEERRILQQRIKDQSAANAVIKAGIESVGDSFDALRARASKTIVQEVDLRPLLTDAAKPIVQKVDVVADNDLEKIRSEAAKPIVQKIDVVTTQSATGSLDGLDIDAYTENLRDSQGEEQAIWARKVQDQADANAKIKAGIGSVGDSLDELRNDASAPIVQTVQVKTTQAGQAAPPLPPSPNGPNPSDYTDELHDSMVKEKAIYEQKVNDQKTAFEKASSEYDKAIATQHKSADEMNKAALKGARGVIDAAKGWAQLGLVGEENAKKLVEGLVLIEGAFNIAKGGVEFLEAFGQGWKAVKDSQAAANNVAKITASLRSAEFAQLRAYHVALVQEAEAASIAAGANGRLAASRGAAAAAAAAGSSAAAGAVGSVATGAAGTAIGGALAGSAVGAGGAVAAGAAWNTLGGVALGGAATIGVFVAAIAGAGFGLRSLVDVLTGTGKEVGSFNDTIAGWEAEIGASMLSMTGMFTSLEDPSTKFAQSIAMNGDAAVAYGRKLTEGIPGAEMFFNTITLATGALGDFATLAASNNALAKAEKRAAEHKIKAEFTDAQENIKRDSGNAVARESFESRNKMRDVSVQSDDKLGQMTAELEKHAEAEAKRAEQLAIINRLTEEGSEHTAEYADAEQQALFFSKQMEQSVTKRMQLESDLTKAAVDGQTKIQDSIKKSMEENAKSLETLEGKQSDAINNFAKMDKLQQTMANNALIQARAQGGGSLNDKQKELLRSVGTDEAKMLASEGDKKEAEDAGFSKTFGSNFEAERKVVESQRQKLEAELDMQYDVTIDMKSDLTDALGKMTESAKELIKAEYERATAKMQEEMTAGLAKNFQDTQQLMKTRNKSR